MTAPAKKKTSTHEPGSRRRVGSTRVPSGRAEIDAGPALGSATGLRVRGLHVLGRAGTQEKEKVSLTLDRSLVDEIRAQGGGRALSTSINDLLYLALAQARLGELVDEMEREAGPPSPDAYERVLDQWFAEN